MEITKSKIEFEKIYFGKIPEREKKTNYYTLLSIVRPNKIWPWTLTNLSKTLHILYGRFFECKNNNLDLVDDQYPINTNLTLCIFNTNLLNKFDQEIYVVSQKILDDQDGKTQFIGFLTLAELNETISNLENGHNKDDCKKQIFPIVDICPPITLNERTAFPGASFEIDLYSEYIKFEICPKEDSCPQDIIIKRKELVKVYIKNKKKKKNNSESEPTFKQKLKDENSILTGWAHLIIDGADNLPVSILNFVFDRENRFYTPEYIQDNILDGDMDANGKTDNYIVLKKILNKALEHTEQLVRYNHTLAPIYHVEQNTMSYIAPLYITYGEKPDCVVILNKDEKAPNKFIPTTLLNLEEARRDVNILGLLDHYATWLL